MSNMLIALIFAAGVSVWVYNKVQRQTGGNTKSSLTVAGLVAGLGFVVLLLILNFVVPAN